MKYLEYLIWIFGGLAGVILLLGVIDFFFHAELISVNKAVNYFHVVSMESDFFVVLVFKRSLTGCAQILDTLEEIKGDHGFTVLMK